ncbi:MAG: hypothetical protein J6O49_05305 [Bacteroidaceae bacterium]|nr:hypothetical protein [Bacteroidaceae bacterium]
MLDSTTSSTTLPAGYYGNISISTTLSPQGNVVYDHHVHSLTTTTEIVSNNSSDPSSVAGALADDYVSSVSGGCFTTPYYHVVYTITESRMEMCGGSVQGGWSDWQTGGVYDRCRSCGKLWGAYTGPSTCNNYVQKTYTTPYDYWTSNASDHPSNRTEVKYSRSCGMANGTVTDAHIHF